jgi:hypothetical protein
MLSKDQLLSEGGAAHNYCRARVRLHCPAKECRIHKQCRVRSSMDTHRESVPHIIQFRYLVFHKTCSDSVVISVLTLNSRNERYWVQHQQHMLAFLILERWEIKSQVIPTAISIIGYNHGNVQLHCAISRWIIEVLFHHYVRLDGCGKMKSEMALQPGTMVILSMCSLNVMMDEALT